MEIYLKKSLKPKKTTDFISKKATASHRTTNTPDASSPEMSYNQPNDSNATNCMGTTSARSQYGPIIPSQSQLDYYISVVGLKDRNVNSYPSLY